MSNIDEVKELRQQLATQKRLHSDAAEVRSHLRDLVKKLTEERDAAREDAERLSQSMDAVVRATRLQAPLNLPVNKPMREWLPGGWPVMSECIEMSNALTAHKALTANKQLAHA